MHKVRRYWNPRFAQVRPGLRCGILETRLDARRSGLPWLRGAEGTLNPKRRARRHKFKRTRGEIDNLTVTGNKTHCLPTWKMGGHRMYAEGRRGGSKERCARRLAVSDCGFPVPTMLYANCARGEGPVVGGHETGRLPVACGHQCDRSNANRGDLANTASHHDLPEQNAWRNENRFWSVSAQPITWVR